VSIRFENVSGISHPSASTRFRIMASPYQASRSYLLDTPHSVGLLYTSDRPDAENSTWRHTTITRDKHLCTRQDSNPQSQQANCRNPML